MKKQGGGMCSKQTASKQQTNDKQGIQKERLVMGFQENGQASVFKPMHRSDEVGY
jgi:hypothetical protein